MDDYHKMPAHHGLRELLGEKMEEETKILMKKNALEELKSLKKYYLILQLKAI